MTSEEIIQRLLDQKKITVEEAMVILKDSAKTSSPWSWPYIYPYYDHWPYITYHNQWYATPTTAQNPNNWSETITNQTTETTNKE